MHSADLIPVQYLTPAGEPQTIYICFLSPTPAESTPRQGPAPGNRGHAEESLFAKGQYSLWSDLWHLRDCGRRTSASSKSP